ncbi:GDSL esterase/lipase [Quillaja saponaria]|uniref:GDSL esterase/lipase n=1 Tax=Quillaja saponaria TaxID=32244 RepID=A0AAD7PHW3_QUISA|nr:GDSL esterase/lipase [Quillaja saponaria]
MMLGVLVTPPPVCEEGRLTYAESLYGEKMKLPERTNETAGLYANACVELAEEMGTRSINLWYLMQETEGWQKKFLSDGLHLTPEGKAVVYHEVLRVLNELRLSAAEMPYDSLFTWKLMEKILRALQKHCL